MEEDVEHVIERVEGGISWYAMIWPPSEMKLTYLAVLDAELAIGQRKLSQLQAICEVNSWSGFLDVKTCVL